MLWRQTKPFFYPCSTPLNPIGLNQQFQKIFGKPILATDLNFNISYGFLAEKFLPLAFINRRTPAAFRHENMTSSLLSLTQPSPWA
jgi:hypothetical protein